MAAWRRPRYQTHWMPLYVANLDRADVRICTGEDKCPQTDK